MPTFNTWIAVDGCGAMPLSLINEQETLSVVGPNLVQDLSFVPTGGMMMLIVNGDTFTPEDGSFNVIGSTIHWTSPDYAITTYDTVVAVYSHMG